VDIQVVMTDRALLAGDRTPAMVPGYGTVPAVWARSLVGVDSDDTRSLRAQVWLRRLYTHPVEGTLVTMDSTRRVFDGALRAFVVARDGSCRTPWCDAPVRHLDHVVDHAKGGPTSAENGQGLCIRCNLVKQLAGWSARTVSAPGRHTVELTTPTGHRYRSNAPPVLPAARSAPFESPLEQHYQELTAA
jgi:HNH endonuclease